VLLLDELHVDHLEAHAFPLSVIGSANDGTGLVLKVVNFSMIKWASSGQLLGYRTHEGGNDPRTGAQVADQVLTRGNLALARSADLGRPVRVVRGSRGDPAYSPASGYRYDGLYRVESYWHERGKSGFRIWRFRLVRLGVETVVPPDQGEATPARVETTVQRIVRNTKVVQRVKELHSYRCQVCGVQILTPSGPYAEGAHIRALGSPHHGPDTEDNVLCLCPNHHVRFDTGALHLNDHLEIIETASGVALGDLRTVPGHRLNTEHIGYHRAVHGS
jgi:putative restriction endonuclease